MSKDFLTTHSIEELLSFENEKNEDIKETDINKENLVKLHNQTKLLFPSYLLRLLSYDVISTEDEKTLDVLLESGSRLAFEELKLRYENNMSKASDELLVLYAQEGDYNSKEILTLRYKSIINSIIQRVEKRYFFRGLEKDDLFQESNLGFFKAIEVFKIERRTKYKDFSRHVIERHLGTLMNRSRNLRNRALNESFSYNTPVNTTNDTTFEDLLEGEEILPEEMYLKKEAYKEIKETLTKNEQVVLKHYSKGFTYEEIAYKLVVKKNLADVRGLEYDDLTQSLKDFEPTYKEIRKYKSMFMKVANYKHIEELSPDMIAYSFVKKKYKNELKNVTYDNLIENNEEYEQEIIDSLNEYKAMTSIILNILAKVESIVKAQIDSLDFQSSLEKEIEKRLHKIAKEDLQEKMGDKVSKEMISETISQLKTDDFEQLIEKHYNQTLSAFKEDVEKEYKVKYLLEKVEKFVDEKEEILNVMSYELFQKFSQTSFSGVSYDFLMTELQWYTDIVEILKKMKKSVDNTIQRIRKKGESYREQYEKGYL